MHAVSQHKPSQLQQSAMPLALSFVPTTIPLDSAPVRIMSEGELDQLALQGPHRPGRLHWAFKLAIEVRASQLGQASERGWFSNTSFTTGLNTLPTF